MSYSHVVQQSVTAGGVSTSKSNTYTANGRVSVAESVANGQTDYEINVDLDVSAVKSFYLVSTQDVTFETNNGATPDDTISLLADVPYVWTEESYDSFLLTVDVTSIFITNASGSAATITLEAIYDPTP